MSSQQPPSPSSSFFYNELSTPQFPPMYFIIVASISSIIYALLYKNMARISEQYLFPQHYKKLKGDKMKELEWNSRVISNIHAIWITIVGMLVFFAEDRFFKHLDMFHHSPLAVLMTASSIGYFFVDSYFVLRYYPKLGGVSMIVHHVAVTSAQLTVVIYRQFQLMGVTLSITEMTTPFINQLWFLTTLDMKSSLMFKINGFLIWFFWLMTRIGYSVATTWLWVTQWHSLITACSFVWIFFTLQLVNITLLNVMWFSKITKGVLKVFFVRRSSTAAAPRAKKE